jgi:D-alanyl-D-alanine carboxypeptidase
MKHKLIILLFIPLFTIFGGCQENAQPVESRWQAVIDSIYAANPASVGIMVHVESPKKGISWSGVSGYPSKDAHARLEPDQPALIASNIKTYVSATILRLVEQGKLSIDRPIKHLLSNKTSKLFTLGGYDLDLITIKHLLSHTSGIQDYANQEYIDFIDKNKNYRWTRDEQLELTIETGAPLGIPGTTFNYADANYLLLTEIIEQITKKPFYGAMRQLLSYQSLGLDNTWIPSLEEKPDQTKTLVHQYWGEQGWDSYDIDFSVDLYGGGGIACTTGDLAIFFHELFHYKIIKDTAIFNLIFTEVPAKDPEPSHYYLGLAKYEYHNLTAYGHSGFWGTIVLYFPEIETSVAVFILERDKRNLRQEIINQIIGILIE